MSTIKSIVLVENKGNYRLTHAVMTDGTEATAYSKPNDPLYKIGDIVSVFYDQKWNKIKFERKNK